MMRVCLVGVESTGKSTLARLLAADFGAALMPEFGRSWAETLGTDFPTNVLREIAIGHLSARAEIETANPAAPPVLIIEDTDIVMTSAWSAMLHGRRDPMLTAIKADADLYLLFSPDTPWIDDGTRQFGGDARRHFHSAIADELLLRGITPVTIAGSWQQRRDATSAAITALIAGRSSQNPTTT